MTVSTMARRRACLLRRGAQGVGRHRRRSAPGRAPAGRSPTAGRAAPPRWRESAAGRRRDRARRAGLRGAFDPQRQQSGNAAQQLQRIVAVEEASGMRLIGQRVQIVGPRSGLRADVPVPARAAAPPIRAAPPRPARPPLRPATTGARKRSDASRAVVARRRAEARRRPRTRRPSARRDRGMRAPGR